MHWAGYQPDEWQQLHGYERNRIVALYEAELTPRSSYEQVMSECQPSEEHLAALRRAAQGDG